MIEFFSVKKQWCHYDTVIARWKRLLIDLIIAYPVLYHQTCLLPSQYHLVCPCQLAAQVRTQAWYKD